MQAQNLATSVALVSNTPLSDGTTEVAVDVFVGDATTTDYANAVTLDVAYSDIAVTENAPITVTYKAENWFGSAAEIVKTVADDRANSVLHLQLSRQANSSVLLQGKIVQLKFIIIDNVGGKGAMPQIQLPKVQAKAENKAIWEVKATPIVGGFALLSDVPITQVLLYSTNGVLLQTIVPNAVNATINTENYAKGVYFACIQLENGQKTVLKLGRL